MLLLGRLATASRHHLTGGRIVPFEFFDGDGGRTKTPGGWIDPSRRASKFRG